MCELCKVVCIRAVMRFFTAPLLVTVQAVLGWRLLDL